MNVHGLVTVLKVSVHWGGMVGLVTPVRSEQTTHRILKSAINITMLDLIKKKEGLDQVQK